MTSVSSTRPAAPPQGGSHIFRLNIPSGSEDVVAHLLRKLCRNPWWVAGRDDADIAQARRYAEPLLSVAGRLGWELVIDRDLVRLKKTPPRRLADWESVAPSPQACSWTFLFAAASGALPQKVLLSRLIDEAKVAAAEAGVQVVEGFSLRKAQVDALKELLARGIVEQRNGNIENYVEDSRADALLTIHHTRLLHLIAHYSVRFDPVTETQEWLDAVAEERDPKRRMRRQLVNDTVVHTADLDPDELDWLSRELRRDGGQIAEAFGMAIERRLEGAAFILDDESYRYSSELGDTYFPRDGVVGQAALLLADFVGLTGRLYADGDDGPGPGWCVMARADAVIELRELASRKKGLWPAWAVDDVSRLLTAAEKLLTDVGLLRVVDEAWWLSPSVGRWEAPPNSAFAPAASASREAESEEGKKRDMAPLFDFGEELA